MFFFSISIWSATIWCLLGSFLTDLPQSEACINYKRFSGGHKDRVDTFNVAVSRRLSDLQTYCLLRNMQEQMEKKTDKIIR